MSEYTGCDKCKFNTRADDEFPCSRCEHNATDHYKPMTNADRIRNMDDRELAEFMTGDALRTINCCDCNEPKSKYGSCIGDCKNPWLRWLQAEVKEGAE